MSTTKIEIGTVVQVTDRNNFGRVTSDNGDGTYDVLFRNPDTGAVEEKTFPEVMLIPQEKRPQGKGSKTVPTIAQVRAKTSAPRSEPKTAVATDPATEAGNAEEEQEEQVMPEKIDYSSINAMLGHDVQFMRVGSDEVAIDVTGARKIAEVFGDLEHTTETLNWLAHVCSKTIVTRAGSFSSAEASKLIHSEVLAVAAGRSSAAAATLERMATVVGEVINSFADVEIDSLMPVIGARPYVARPGEGAYAPEILGAGHMPGLHLLIGEGGSGKSTHLFEVVKPEVVIRYGEPSEMYDAQGEHKGVFVVPVNDANAAIGLALVLAFAGFGVAIDSLRELLFGIKGAAAAGGISTGFYSLITSMSNLYAQTGSIVIAVANPMTVGEKAEVVYSALLSSASGVTSFVRGSSPVLSYRSTEGRVIGKGVDADSAQIYTQEDWNHGVIPLASDLKTSPKIEEERIVTLPGAELTDRDDDDTKPRTGSNIRINFQGDK